MEKVKTPDSKTIDELCAFLKIDKTKTAKALFMVGTYIDPTNGAEQDKLIVGLVRGDMDIEENKLQNAAKCNSMRPAHPEEILAAGMVPGFGSPIGAKEGVVKIIDDSVANSNNLVAGANEEGYHYLNTNYGRDYDGQVADIASAAEGYFCPVCGAPLRVSKGVEAGNIFQLGTRYSAAMNLYFQDENGERKPVIMGSYGIGVGRLLACLAEEYHDDAGLELPITVAPYQVHFVSLAKDPEVGEKIYQELVDAGIEVLYDDRKESAGVKFKDADLIGLPIRITIGNRSLQNGKAEVKLRRDLSTTMEFDLDNLTAEVKDLITKLTKEITDKMVVKEWRKR
jgi:prolyl-tRNA synthetase